MLKQMRKLAIVAGVLVGVVAGIAPTAGADTISMTGSDTTYWLMNTIGQTYNVNRAANPSLANLSVNVAPQVIPPFPPGIVVPADANCAERIYKASLVPPNGSSAGITDLRTDTTGCTDLARSSRNRDATRGDTADLEFYAFGLGALDWVKFPGNPVANLTVNQLVNVYTCSASGPNVGKPIIATWGQIPGSGFTGAIKKYAPQLSSGTAGFFQTKLLNGHTIDENCDATHKSTFLQEHDARGVTAATKARAIYVYDYGQFVSQEKKLSPDLRNGAVFGSLNGKLPTPTTVNETATRFVGTRYLFNVVKNNVNSPSYAKALKFAGVSTNAANGFTGNGWICKGGARAIVRAFGFFPLAQKLDPNTGILSYCRKEPTSL